MPTTIRLSTICIHAKNKCRALRAGPICRHRVEAGNARGGLGQLASSRRRRAAAGAEVVGRRAPHGTPSTGPAATTRCTPSPRRRRPRHKERHCRRGAVPRRQETATMWRQRRGAVRRRSTATAMSRGRAVKVRSQSPVRQHPARSQAEAQRTPTRVRSRRLHE